MQPFRPADTGVYEPIIAAGVLPDVSTIVQRHVKRREIHTIHGGTS